MSQAEGHPSTASSNTADAAAVTTINTPSAPVQRQSVRVAVKLGDRAMLIPSHNDATQSGDEVMRQIRREYDDAMVGIRHRCLRSPFRKPAVYIGTLSTVWLPHDAEAGEVLREVAFSRLEYSPDLTAAFFRADILRGTRPFAERYPETVAGTLSAKAIVIASKIDKMAVCNLLALSLLLATAAGLGIGIGTSSIQNGFACFAGVSTLLPLLVSCLQWVGS